MTSPVFITRVVLRNYKSIGFCDVKLGPLTYMVGANGSGKSNFLDALHLVSDALTGSLDNALNERGGLTEVRRRSKGKGRPTHFGIRLEFVLPSGQCGHYAFNVGALADRGYEVQKEECRLTGEKGWGEGLFFRMERGELKGSSEATFPAVTPDRLALVAASGMPVFRPVFDALTGMGFYNLNPKLMRDLQKPQDGRLLKSVGENIVSVIGHLERTAPGNLKQIESYLQTVVPMMRGLERKQIGPLETLEFKQEVADDDKPMRFPAQNMSDGTLRVVGILTALFQGNKDHTPRLIGIEEPETALHPAASAALREALSKASETTQVIVTSHSPELLDDRAIQSAQILAVTSEGGNTCIGPLDDASAGVMRDHLFSAGELLRLNQLQPNESFLREQAAKQAVLFDELEP